MRPHSPVVYLVRCREALCGPVDETVEKDKCRKARPHPHDHLERHACIVDHLGRRQRGRKRAVTFLINSLLPLKVHSLMLFGHLGAAEHRHIISPGKVVKQLLSHPAGIGQHTHLFGVMSIFACIAFVIYLDSGEGDSRGGVGANHQRHDGGAQSTKHVGEL